MKMKRVTKERYWEMLEILPPATWNSAGFLVGEPWDHNREGFPRYQAFLEKNGRFYECDTPMTVREFHALVKSGIKEPVDETTI